MSSENSALVAYLRIEADLAVERAKRLTSLIDVLTHGGSDSPSARSNNTSKVDEDELAPLDEFGNPKYKGKKRGRKSTKKRKRAKDPNKPKKSQTAYTCFIQDNYKHIQTDLPDLKAKEVITILAQRWADATDEEKLKYKQKAANKANQDNEEVEVEEVEVEEMAEDDGEEMVDIATAVADAQMEKIGTNGDLNCGEVLKKVDQLPRKKVVHDLLKRANEDDDDDDDEDDDEEEEDEEQAAEDW